MVNIDLWTAVGVGSAGAVVFTSRRFSLPSLTKLGGIGSGSLSVHQE